MFNQQALAKETCALLVANVLTAFVAQQVDHLLLVQLVLHHLEHALELVLLARYKTQHVQIICAVQYVLTTECPLDFVQLILVPQLEINA
jgi:hypothetical protein